MSKSIKEYNQRRIYVPCVDDAGDPSEKPESNVYPNICSKVRVRGRGMRLDEGVPAVHRAFSKDLTYKYSCARLAPARRPDVFKTH